jgi:hypothetical protein
MRFSKRMEVSNFLEPDILGIAPQFSGNHGRLDFIISIRTIGLEEEK